ncbi:putative ferric-chelate reductase 1 homolog [Daphnia carinata]|uniref:putative ferric-chelate reductase 1 homolog n=1 Tax=Daphnia carinata TaxID=120202 RepID=UPI00257ADECB|nr:putative ferric-chelate reductase 1 homolog [Daphnia carinata]
MFVIYSLLVVITYSSVWIEVTGSSSGAPATACDSMTPGHGCSPMTVPCPFETLLNQTEISSSDILAVTIQQSVSSAQSFKGFLIMAFDTKTDGVVGTFKIASLDETSKTLDCSGEYENAATHRTSSQKQSVTLEWIPPESFDGEVFFKTTFVESFCEYWVQELSKQTVKITRSEMTTPTASETSPTTKLPMPDVYAGCGVSKGCIATPDGCVDSKSCSMMTTYRKMNDRLQLEIYGQMKGDEYVAIGFSADSKMGSDSVAECVQYRNVLAAYQSYNTKDRNNERLPTNVEGFALDVSTFSEGYIYCSLQHPLVYQNHNQNFDLNEPHYILMATGVTGKDNIQQHTTEEKSRFSIDLTNGFSVSYFNQSRILKQLHGSFMVIAWLMAASIGILMPRYMKKTWVGKQFMKKDLWFVFHRGLMVLVWTLTVAGFIIIFVDVGGWVSESISENPHPLIGCITTVLAFIQPFMALMRPLPNAPNRYIFNWAHMLVGYSAHTLAITCIFLAVEMEEAQLPYETYWVLTAHVCCYFCAQLLLTVLARRKSETVQHKHSEDERGTFGRKLILAWYSSIVVALGFTIIVFIAGP